MVTENLKELCKKYRLDATPAFWAATETQIKCIYNGAGPDWLPRWGRDILTAFLDIFQPAFIVHDFDFDKSNKTISGFNAANNRMLFNMLKILNKTYPLTNPLKWKSYCRWLLRAMIAYYAVKKGGWSAWMD